MNTNKIKQMQASANKAAAFLKLLGNTQRLLILCQLVDGEKNVGQIQKNTDLSQSALSQHLAILRQGEVVQTRKEAQTIYYQLADDNVKQMLNTLYNIYCK